MAVVFSVLGKIGYVLLVMLCLVLLLVFLILVCPICYRCSFDKGEELSVKGMVRWLFFLIYVPFSYEGEGFRYSIRILGIPLRRRKRKKQDEASEDAGESAQEVPKEKELMATEEGREDAAGKEELETEAEHEEAQEERMDAEPKKRASKQKKNVAKKKRKVSIRHMFQKVREFFLAVGNIKEFLKEENTKQTVCIIKDNVLHLLKKLKPKKIKGYIEFGTGDPCQTGQILAVLACLYAYYDGGVEVVPDFMEKKFMGHLEIKGRITLFTCVMVALRIILNKGFRRFRKEVKELKEAL